MIEYLTLDIFFDFYLKIFFFYLFIYFIFLGLKKNLEIINTDELFNKTNLFIGLNVVYIFFIPFHYFLLNIFVFFVINFLTYYIFNKKISEHLNESIFGISLYLLYKYF